MSQFRPIRRLYRSLFWKNKSRALKLDSNETYKHSMWVETCIKDPDFPWMISFPRTGSNWLRMIMELYFRKPALTGSFYHPYAVSFTCYARHDINLKLKGIRNVIYLHREPVSTVFSFMKYHHGENIFNLPPNASYKEQIKACAQIYGRHVAKWMLHEQDSQKKCCVSYDKMRQSPHDEFKKISNFFEMPFDPKKLDFALSHATKIKNEKKQKNKNPRVVITEANYENDRVAFSSKYSKLINEYFMAQDPQLLNYHNLSQQL